MRRLSSYNLVEVVLALGVLAIGVCSIMGLFPVGAAATRDAVAETYAANAADQLVQRLKFKIKDDWVNWHDSLSEANDADVDAEGCNGEQWNRIGGTVFQRDDEMVFQVLSYRGNAPSDLGNEDEVDEKTDFRVLALVSSPEKNDGYIRLKIELEWPVEFPKASRRRVEYVYDVFNMGL